MQTFTIIALLLCTSPAWAAITEPGGCQATGTSCTPSAFRIGDIAVVTASHTGATTIPSLPSGWTSITTQTVTGDIGQRIACKIIPPGTWATATFTNATYVVTHIWRGANVTGTRSCGAIGTPVKNTSTGTATYVYGGVTLTNDGGASTSWVAGDIIIDGVSSGSLAAPTGMTQQQVTSGGTAPGSAAQDTNGAVSSWTTTNVTGGASVPYADVTYEINAAPVLTACSSHCPDLVDSKSGRSNDSIATATVFHTDLANPSLANNLIVCGYSYASTTDTVAITDDKSNTWTNSFIVTKSANLSAGISYAANVAAGTLHLTFTVSGAVDNVTTHCDQFRNMATSSVTDGSGACTSSCTAAVAGPIVSTGALSTSNTNDLIYVYGVDDAGVALANFVNVYAPQGGMNLLPLDQSLGTFAEFVDWGGSGSFTPSINIQQSSNDSFDMVAVAFKSASTGTAPTGIWVPCESTLTFTANPQVVQTPCPFTDSAINLRVNLTEYDTVNTVTAISDESGNSWTKIANGAGNPQLQYAQNATYGASNSAWVSATHGSINGTYTTYEVVGADTSAFDNDAYNAINQTNAGGASCPGASGSTVTFNFTPTTNRSGVTFMVDFNGTGPECEITSPSGAIFDAHWYSGETDADSYGYGASLRGHYYYSTNAAQTYTYPFANATTSSGQGLVAAFKAPAASSGHCASCDMSLLKLDH